MILNKLILIGRLTKDPELKTITNGTQVCNFTIAVDKQFNKEHDHPEAMFINVVAWKQKAEFVSKYFKKGNRIIVQGSLDSRSYVNKEDKKITVFEVNASNIDFVDRKSEQNESNTEQYTSNNRQNLSAEDQFEPEGTEEEAPY